MSQENNAPYFIGLFVVGALLLLLIGLLFISDSSFGKKNYRYVVYFDESLNGLTIGAPVKLKGVQIGKVTDIQVQVDNQKHQIVTPVFIEVMPDKIVHTTGYDNYMKNIQDLIAKGLRVQLQLTSLVTGQLYLEAKMMPNTPIRLSGIKNDVLEIPTVPSIQQNVSGILGKLEKIPMDEIIAELVEVVHSIKLLSAAPETKQSLLDLAETLNATHRMMDNLNQIAPSTLKDIGKTARTADRLLGRVDLDIETILKQVKTDLTTADKSLVLLNDTIGKLNSNLTKNPELGKNLNGLLSNAEQILDPNSQTLQNLNDMMKDVSKATQSVRFLSDYLAKHPESLLQGREYHPD